VADRIVVIGSLNMDLVGCAPRIPVVGETIVGHAYFSEPGGKGANQAYAAARLVGASPCWEEWAATISAAR
jgi:ribokinase